jgi:hypothetical protein
VNQPGFLPHQAKLIEISSEGVQFADAEGNLLLVTELSDGYRSILSLTFELIRQMSRVFQLDLIFDPRDDTKIIAPGVVLIDEVDAHLHPTWQRRIGFWMREHFPNIQFIVTTHSPLICQAAEVGSVWHLPAPGSGEEFHQVTGNELNRLLYGNVLEAYGTEAFGVGNTRSEVAKAHSRRLAELNVRELQAGLSKEEKLEQARLRVAMPTSAHEVTNEYALNFRNVIVPAATPFLTASNGAKKPRRLPRPKRLATRQPNQKPKRRKPNDAFTQSEIGSGASGAVARLARRSVGGERFRRASEARRTTFQKPQPRHESNLCRCACGSCGNVRWRATLCLLRRFEGCGKRPHETESFLSRLGPLV